MYKHPIAKERSSIFHRENIPFSALPPPTLSRIRSESVSLGSLLKKSRLDVRIVVPLSIPTESVAQNNTSSSSRRVKRPEKLAIVVDRLGVTRRVSANGTENFESPPAAADQLNYELCTDIFTKARSKVAGSVIIHSFFLEIGDWNLCGKSTKKNGVLFLKKESRSNRVDESVFDIKIVF